MHRKATENVVAIRGLGCKPTLALRTPRPRLTFAYVRWTRVAVSSRYFELVWLGGLRWRNHGLLRHAWVAIADAILGRGPMVVVRAGSVVLKASVVVVLLLRPERVCAPIARDGLLDLSPGRRLLCSARRCTCDKM
jgi:hypothetical protein